MRFEELDWRTTPIGEVSLRRRFDPVLKTEVYEVKLDEEFLMSSVFTAAEEALSRLGLAEVDGSGLDVVVGGLGLGYTARTALDDPRVGSLTVVEALEPVLGWHRRHLIPDTAGLADDPRVRFIHDDFFTLADNGFDAARPGRRHDVILLDIDHSPSHLLADAHAAFYTPDGLGRMSRRLRPGGGFALWSNDPPDDEFTARLRQVFGTARAEVITFPNPLQGKDATNTIYLAADPM